MVKRGAPWRRSLIKWAVIGAAVLVALILLIETTQFLIERKLVRDTLMSAGLGERIEDARVTVDSCTTVGVTKHARRGGTYYDSQTDCEVTIYVPAKAPYRQVEKSLVRIRLQDDARETLGAGRLLGKLGTRWSSGALLGMWLETPNAFILLSAGLFGIGAFGAWRWRRWWWHDRFRHRRRF